jgi:hypothetical protein
MNDALMIGVVLTLVFGSIIFYLYNRLTMTEKKMGLFEGVLTDLKMMLDAAPFASGPPPSHMQEFEPTPEYLNAISGPVPIQQDEVEDVDAAASEEYQQTLEQALESASATEAMESKTLQIDESSASLVTGTNAPVSVTKLSPDLDTMSVAELKALAKQKNLTVPAGARRKDLLDLLKRSSSLQGQESTMLDGPAPPAEGAAFESSGLVETTI